MSDNVLRHHSGAKESAICVAAPDTRCSHITLTLEHRIRSMPEAHSDRCRHALRASIDPASARRRNDLPSCLFCESSPRASPAARYNIAHASNGDVLRQARSSAMWVGSRSCSSDAATRAHTSEADLTRLASQACVPRSMNIAANHKS